MSDIQQIIKDSKFIPEIKKILFNDCIAQLEGTFGISKSGKFECLSNLPNVKEGTEEHEVHKKLEKYMKHKKESGVNPREALVDFIREYAFTYLNRFVAFKMMEERKILRQTVSREFDSNSFKFYMADYPEDEKRWKQGNAYEAYKNFIHWQCREICKDNEIKVLFNPENIVSYIFPQERTLKNIFRVINQKKLTQIWKEDEVIGWVYQYFIEDDKDRVFDKIYRQKQKMDLKDIAPATQIFTPRWIVQYLVENTLGRLWIRMHPETILKEKMKYYVPNDNDKELIPLKPVKDITLLDPACGTMHFGMVAFDLFYDMYLEEIENVNKNGWPEKPSCEKDILIPASIIQNNLYGIDIDLRAIQLSALALYLKAKSKCKEITIERYNLVHTDIPAFSDESINEFVDSLSPKYELTKKLFKIVMPELAKAYYLGSLLKLEDIINSFLEKQYTILSKKFGKQMHFGFAIEKEQEEILFKKELVWSEIKEELRDALNEFIEKANGNTDSFMAQETKKGVYLVDTLMRKYDVVVTNPPFSSQRNMNQILRKNLKLLYENKFQDFYTCFIARALELVLKNGFVGMITLHSFMFTSSFQNIREEITLKKRLETLAHLGPTFMDLSNPFAQQCVMFVVSNNNLSKSKVPCFRLVDFLYKKKEIRFLECVNNYKEENGDSSLFLIQQNSFSSIPGRPLVYWINKKVLNIMANASFTLKDIIEVPNRTKTGLDDRYIRYEWEVGFLNIGQNNRWIKYCKGEGSEKWVGYINRVINWSYKNRVYFRTSKKCRITDEKYWFVEGVTYSSIKTNNYSFRYLPSECVYDVGGPALLPVKYDAFVILGFLNSYFSEYILSLINPTINLQTGDVTRIPFPKNISTVDADYLRKNSYKCYECKLNILEKDETFYKFVNPFNWEKGIIEKMALEKEIIINEFKISSRVHSLFDLDEKSLKDIYDKKIILSISNSQKVNINNCDLELIDYLYMNRHIPSSPLKKNYNNVYEESIEKEDIQQKSPSRRGRSKRYLTLEEICLASGFHPETVYEYIKANHLERKEERFDLAVRYISYALGILMGQFKFSGIEPDDDGITVIDEGHSDDAPTKVREILDKVLNEKEAKEVIDVVGGDLRKFLINNFFAKYHIPMYKKRPVYWLLQTEKKNYGFYIYNLKFSQDTLYSLIQKYIIPRINLEKLRLQNINNRKKIANTPKEEREIEKLIVKSEEFIEELMKFKQNIQEIIDTGFKPDIDDGVILNMAPLYKLISWKEPEKYYKNLQMGQYEWAHVSRYFGK
jgi:hypothetical protein